MPPNRELAGHLRATAAAFHACDLEGARAAARAALACADRASPEAAELRLVLSTVALKQGQPGRALQEANRARAWSQRDRGAPRAAFVEVRALGAAGRAHLYLGRYDAADEHQREALDKARRLALSVEIASALNDVGITSKYLGSWARAARAYREALAIVKGEPRSDAQQGFLASLLHNLGGLEHARERHREGVPWARAALRLRRALRGPDHADVAADEVALSGLLLGLGRHREAERLLEHALAVFRRVYGDDHPEVASALHNLGSSLHARGRFDEAELAYRRALSIERARLGSTHPETLRTRLNLGAMLVEADDPRGLPLLASARDSLRRVLGPRHPLARAAAAASARHLKAAQTAQIHGEVEPSSRSQRGRAAAR
ncbi:MAG: tetratricopeptide repeat protein [Polyangiaceae bacterium]